MGEKRRKNRYNPLFHVECEYRCDNIFKTSQKQPYLDSTQSGKWGRGKDDSPVNEEEYPPKNNPLPR